MKTKQSSSSRTESECEKIWEAGRDLERAEEAMETAKYRLKRIVENEYASEMIMSRAKDYLKCLAARDLK